MRVMEWSEFTQNWETAFPRAKQRFPNLGDALSSQERTDRTRFEAHLARTHHLTMEEARQELADFLFVESLAREAGH